MDMAAVEVVNFDGSLYLETTSVLRVPNAKLYHHTAYSNFKDAEPISGTLNGSDCCPPMATPTTKFMRKCRFIYQQEHTNDRYLIYIRHFLLDIIAVNCTYIHSQYVKALFGKAIKARGWNSYIWTDRIWRWGVVSRQ